MREIFSLVGRIYTDGLDTLQTGLKNVDKQVTQVTKKVDKFGRDLTKLGVSITKLTVPIAAMGAAAFKGVQAASDLSETVSKVGQIFGDSAGEVETWAGTTAEALGQSKQQALDAAATFAIFGKSAGLSGDSLVNFSTNFTQLASDLASFNNTSPEDAITAIGAALRGESEPIRRYGVLLDDATMRQKALELGIAKTTKNALTPQQKVLAASALIMEKTKDAQGDFARTSEGLANQTRILKAQFADLTAEFGKAFLPVALQVATVVRERILPAVKGAVNWWNNLSDGLKQAIIVSSGVAVALGPVLIGIGQAVSMVKTLVTVFKMLNLVMISNPIGLVITLVAGLVAAGVLLYKNWDFVKEKMLAAWDAMVYGVEQAVSYLKTLVFSYVKLYVDAFDTVAQHIPGLNKAVDSLQAKLKSLLSAEKAGRYERKAARMETRQQAVQTEQLAKVVEQAKAATAEYNQVSLDGIDIKTKDVEVTKKQRFTALELFNNRREFETEWSDKLRSEVSSRAQLLDIEYRQAIAQADRYGADRQDIETYYQIQRLKLAADEQRKKSELEKKFSIAYSSFNDERSQMGTDFVNLTFSLFAQSTDNKIALIENESARNKAAIENSVMSEADKSARIAAIEAKADEQKRKLMQKQARRDKAAAIFNAILGGAQMVMNGLNTQPFFPLGIIMGALAGALAAAQIAIIAARPLPQLADGGVAKARPGGMDVTIAEGGQDEMILPMRTGVADIVRGVINGIAGAVLPPAASPALAFGGGGSAAPARGSRGGDTHYHIGTLIADESGYKMLERKMRPIRTAEDQRRGL